MKLAKRQTQSTAVDRVSQNVIVQALEMKKFDFVSLELPRRIEGTFDLPKVREMILATGEQKVRAFVEFELIKLAERINVGGNLTDGQIQFIASQLVETYPNETIGDFKLCFERGSSGQYGKIFKLDGVEVGNWMKVYLDEKYQVLERQLMKEKDDFYTYAKQHTDWLKLWEESIKKTDAEGGVKTTSKNIHYLNQLRGMTPEEVEVKGQEKPKYEAYPVSSIAEIEKHELHLEWARRNFDTRTGDKLPTWKPEAEWVEALTDDQRIRIFKQAGLL